MRYLLLFLSCLLYQVAAAQFEGQVYQPTDFVKVLSNAQEKTMAWCGGFNNPQMSMADLNNDGKEDLVIYERVNKQVKTFINFGTSGNPDYRYDPAYSLNFPTVSEYLILADYNNDGIKDLFERGITGFQVYKGYYNGNNALCFSFYQALYYSNDDNTTGSVNVYVDPSDIPAVYDVDNDGDLDIVSFYSGGSRLYFYRNMRVEDGLPADSIRIKLRDRCWGKVYQGFIKPYTLNDPCSNDGLSKPAGGERHTGNTLCMFDANGDGDADILNGNLSFSDIQFLNNGKAQSTNGIDSILSQDTSWQSYNLSQWPSAFSLDIDQDGKKDILITPHGDGISENYKTIALYRNTGTVSSPVFTYQSDTFLVDKTIDVGTTSRPFFYDYDRDGKPDLLVGSEGYFESGVLRSKIAYYRNTSTLNNPSFDFQTNDLLGFSSLQLKGSSPAAGDLDGDGKDDLVLGQADGTLTMYSNTAASNTVQPIWANPVIKIQDINSTIIDIGSAAAPVIYDIDLDGRPDLLVGTLVGYLVYYRNVTTIPGQLQLERVNGRLGQVKADPQVPYLGYCTPYIGKMDNTSIDYIVTGSATGSIYRFTGFQTGDTTITYPMTDSVYSWINGVGIRSAPAIADVDGNGMYEMVIGNQFGGLFLFRQWVNASVNNTASSSAVFNASIYPNPATDHIDISWSSITNDKDVDILLINTTGQKILRYSVSGTNTYRINISELPAGIYHCILTNGNSLYTATISILR
jgi:hypothetical protein